MDEEREASNGGVDYDVKGNGRYTYLELDIFVYVVLYV
ncbi:uncharacterized protein G2W53_038604 [Senna tora]|uniref:Uncharacterized protein n=1 Tax=Senna tora TaxID=362788 RepID=A0A834SPC9_9FABA|nr:uncharacterized protein G2W53_038604 [Senna tora]